MRTCGINVYCVQYNFAMRNIALCGIILLCRITVTSVLLCYLLYMFFLSEAWLQGLKKAPLYFSIRELCVQSRLNVFKFYIEGSYIGC